MYKSYFADKTKTVVLDITSASMLLWDFHITISMNNWDFGQLLYSAEYIFHGPLGLKIEFHSSRGSIALLHYCT